jgi:hypothetical protein
MLKFVSKALLSVVMDKSARDKLKANRKPRDEKTGETTSPPPTAATARAATGKPTDRNAKPAIKPKRAGDGAPRPMTPDRQALIREALEIQKSKDSIFDNLSDDAKAKLLIAAVKAMGIPPDDFEQGLKRRPNGTPAFPPPPRKKR